MMTLNDFITPLLNKLSPVQRQIILKKLIAQLRDNNQQRIKAQQNPDGSAYTPRKSNPEIKGLRHKRGAMFSKLRLSKHLRLQINANEAALGFSGRNGLIARQHQEGIPDTSNSRIIPTTKRQLLGITADDEDAILDLLLRELAQD